MLRRIDIKIADNWEEPLLGLAESLGLMSFSSPCLIPLASGGEEEIAFSGETVVSILFSTVEQDAPGINRKIRSWLRREKLKDVKLAVVDYPDQQDWMEGFRQYFQPIRTGRGILVCPPWSVPDSASGFSPDEPAMIRILIDPGMAFGTGTHETTRLCLQLLEDLPLEKGRFLDLGAGSGILAFYIAKRGASAVVAVEKEGPAVENLRKNAALNDISEGFEIICGDLADFNPPFSANGLVANLTSPILLENMSRFVGWIGKKGWAVFSGVNSTNAPSVREAFSMSGFELKKELVDGEWHGFLAQKKKSPEP